MAGLTRYVANLTAAYVVTVNRTAVNLIAVNRQALLANVPACQ